MMIQSEANRQAKVILTFDSTYLPPCSFQKKFFTFLEFFFEKTLAKTDKIVYYIICRALRK